MTGPLYVLLGAAVLFVAYIAFFNIRDAFRAARLVNRAVDRHRVGKP